MAEEMPQCPGCHIGCNLAKPQCGKGLKFVEMLAAGEELPERRGPGGPRGGKPGPGGPGGPKGEKKGGFAGPPNATIEMRMNHLAMIYNTIMPGILANKPAMQADDKTNILTWMGRTEGKMARAIMPERVRGIDADNLDATLAEMVEAGLVETVEVNGVEFYQQAAAGADAVKEYEKAHADSVAETFSMLTEDEIITLVTLSHKIMEANRPAGGPGPR